MEHQFSMEVEGSEIEKTKTRLKEIMETKFNVNKLKRVSEYRYIVNKNPEIDDIYMVAVKVKGASKNESQTNDDYAHSSRFVELAQGVVSNSSAR